MSMRNRRPLARARVTGSTARARAYHHAAMPRPLQPTCEDWMGAWAGNHVMPFTYACYGFGEETTGKPLSPSSSTKGGGEQNSPKDSM